MPIAQYRASPRITHLFNLSPAPKSQKNVRRFLFVVCITLTSFSTISKSALVEVIAQVEEEQQAGETRVKSHGLEVVNLKLVSKEVRLQSSNVSRKLVSSISQWSMSRAWVSINMQFRSSRTWAPVNLDRIQHWIDQGRLKSSPEQPITARELLVSGCIHNVHDGVKLLGSVSDKNF